MEAPWPDKPSGNATDCRTPTPVVDLLYFTLQNRLTASLCQTLCMSSVMHKMNGTVKMSKGLIVHKCTGSLQLKLYLTFKAKCENTVSVRPGISRLSDLLAYMQGFFVQK